MNQIKQSLAGLSPEKRALLEARLLKEGDTSRVLIPLRDPAKPCRLSFAQEQLWFLDQIEPGTPTYNIAEILRLRGQLDLAALEASLSQLLSRHEALRTTFASDSMEPVQVIEPPQPVRLQIVNLGHLPEPERAPEAFRLANEEARRPFDLSTGPLIRFQVARLCEDDFVLGIYLHHIIFDAWSMGVMTQELRELYRAFVERRAPLLEELPVQYADFAQWQRSWVESEIGQRQLAYWRERLAGAPELLALPGDRPRPAAQSYRGGYQTLVVPRALADELQAVGRREGATPFMTLLAVFDVLLLAYTGQEDLVVGTPVAGRSRLDIEKIVGFFVNTVVLRTDAGGNPTFQELLRRVRDTATGAFTHQDTPFEKLVEALRPARAASYNPLFQVMFILQNAPGEELELPGLRMSGMPIATGTSKFDLTLFAWEKSDGLHLEIEYNSDLFDDGTIQRMLGHFRRLIEGVVANPICRIRQIPLLTGAERNQLLVEWNNTARREFAADCCLHELIEAQVNRTPEAIAVTDEFSQLTYSELNSRANLVANHLRQLGVGPEALVPVCLERSAEMIIALLGILKAGGAYVPLDPEYPKERAAFMLEDTCASVVLTNRKLAGELPPSPAKLLCIDELMAGTVCDDLANAGPTAAADNLAYVIYTSGSTGKPKGAMNEHRGIVNRLLWMQGQYQLTEADAVIQKTPYSFDVSVWEFFWPLLAGSRLVFAKPGGHRDPAYLIRLINENRITTIHFVPPMLRTFLAEPGVESCRSLRRVICSGEALPFDLQEDFFQKLPAELYNLYGPTEAAVDVTHWACQRNSLLRVVPIGRPVANTQAYILDASLQPVPVGVPGELHIGGVQVGRGYLHRPELTKAKFIPDHFSGELGARLYKTGDLCRYHADGNIEYLERLDFQVKIRGFRIELGEIESVFCGHPAVRDAAVLARENTPGNKQLVAYLVMDSQVPVSELRDHLKKKLPDYMVPSAFVFLGDLPLTTNGKVNRKALPEPDQLHPELADAFIAPRNETETTLASIWREVLNVDRIGIHDNFFELGGQSLLILRVVSRIRNQFGVDLPLTVVFESQTIAQLAAKLSDHEIAGLDHLELARLLEEIESETGNDH